MRETATVNVAGFVEGGTIKAIASSGRRVTVKELSIVITTFLSVVLS